MQEHVIHELSSPQVPSREGGLESPIVSDLLCATLSRCDIRARMHKYKGGGKSVQIRIVHVQ